MRSAKRPVWTGAEMTITAADIDLALIGDSRSLDEVIRIASVADRAGVKNFWMTEGTGRDAFAVLTAVALATERIGLGTGIVNTWSRTPTALAQATRTVMELMGDRTFNLGLGSSGKALIEKFHGVSFQAPMQRLEECVRSIDHIFRTGNVPGPGKVFATRGAAIGRPGIDLPDRQRLKIYVAGLNPRSIQITGRYADGWLPIWPSKTRGVQALEVLTAAATDAGRPVPDISSYVYGVISDDPRLVQLVRGTLAWYIAANGVVYRNLFTRMGYEKEVAEVVELWNAGRRDEARRVVDQAMLEDTALIGDVIEFERSVAEFRSAGVGRVILQFPPTTPIEDILSMMGKLEPTAA